MSTFFVKMLLEGIKTGHEYLSRTNPDIVFSPKRGQIDRNIVQRALGERRTLQYFLRLGGGSIMTQNGVYTKLVLVHEVLFAPFLDMVSGGNCHHVLIFKKSQPQPHRQMLYFLGRLLTQLPRLSNILLFFDFFLTKNA